MKSMLIVFFIIFFILLILILPFKARLMAHINLLDLKGFYSLKIFKIRLLTGKIYITNGELKIDNEIDKITTEYDSDFDKAFSKFILKEIDIKKMEIFFTGGFVDDSYASAIMCGTISSAVQTAYSYLTQKYYNVKLYQDINPTFNEDNLELTFDIVVSVSIFGLLKSVIKSAISLKKLKENNNER